MELEIHCIYTSQAREINKTHYRSKIIDKI